MAASDQSWKLETPIAEATQGFVVSGFAALQAGRALFLELPGASNGAWLAELQAAYPVTPASQIGGGAKVDHAVSMAFTWSGLERMGLPAPALASFSAPFREGMFQEDRLRRLGDRRNGNWLDTTGKRAPRWSGNIPPKARDERPEAYDVALDNAETAVTTEISVHALLLIYTSDAAHSAETPVMDRVIGEVEAILTKHGVAMVHQLPLVLDVEGKGFSREHFGFADGLSQPQPFDKGGALRPGKPQIPAQSVPLGEIMLGYKNAHQEVPPGPVVDGIKDNRVKDTGLTAHPRAQGFCDIGLNGSYLVVRELRQDVPAFWQSMDRAAQTIRDADPEASEITGEWLAEKVVGRTKEGHVLTPKGPHKPDAQDRPENDFLFYETDAHGTGCPLGSHIRRAHPRDSLAPKPELTETLLKAANNHRILRRGRKYGPKIADARVDDGQDRGLLFMCLNTDIARQFEFVQQTWLLNSDFETLFEEVDPLIGADGGMTVPEDGLRRRVHVQTFVHMMGGEYFFLPSLPTLTYLARL
ncbi:MAG: hypothetical protein AAGF22_00600 [Pseudomonadota bacterium]